MKFQGASIVFLCFLADNVDANPRRGLQWRRQDQYEAAPPPSGNDTKEFATSTALVTAMHTVTSCAPDVTNCPAATAGAVSSALAQGGGGDGGGGEKNPGVSPSGAYSYAAALPSDLAGPASATAPPYGAPSGLAAVQSYGYGNGNASGVPSGGPAATGLSMNGLSSAYPQPSGLGLPGTGGPMSGTGAGASPSGAPVTGYPPAASLASNSPASASLPPSSPGNVTGANATVPAAAGNAAQSYVPVSLPSPGNSSASTAAAAGNAAQSYVPVSLSSPGNSSASTAAAAGNAAQSYVPVSLPPPGNSSVSTAAVAGNAAAQTTAPPPYPVNATAAGNAAQGLTTPAPYGNVSQTTITVRATQINTVISCAPTVTSCPAATDTAALSALPYGAASTVVVTSTVAEYTTICPVTAASSLSTSLLSSIASALTTVSFYLPAPTGPVGGTRPEGPVGGTTPSLTQIVTMVPTTVTQFQNGTAAATVLSSVPLTTQVPAGGEGGSGGYKQGGLGGSGSGSEDSSSEGSISEGSGSEIPGESDGSTSESSSQGGSSDAGMSGGYEQGEGPSGAGELTTSLVVRPTQSVVTVTVSGQPALFTSNGLMTSSVTVQASSAVTQTVVAGGGSGGGYGGGYGDGYSNGNGSVYGISSAAAVGNGAESATVLVPTQEVITVTVSGGGQSLSTSTGVVTQQTVYVTANAPAATQVVTVTQIGSGGGGAGQCQASTVTVCATDAICPTGSLKL